MHSGHHRPLVSSRETSAQATAKTISAGPAHEPPAAMDHSPRAEPDAGQAQQQPAQQQDTSQPFLVGRRPPVAHVDSKGSEGERLPEYVP